MSPLNRTCPTAHGEQASEFLRHLEFGLCVRPVFVQRGETTRADCRGDARRPRPTRPRQAAGQGETAGNPGAIEPVFASTSAPGPVYSGVMAHVIERDSWADAPDCWKGELQCGQFGANSCLIFNYQPTVGGGPRLHKHPYAEIFVIRSGPVHDRRPGDQGHGRPDPDRAARHAAQIHQSRAWPARKHRHTRERPLHHRMAGIAG